MVTITISNFNLIKISRPFDNVSFGLRIEGNENQIVIVDRYNGSATTLASNIDSQTISDLYTLKKDDIIRHCNNYIKFKYIKIDKSRPFPHRLKMFFTDLITELDVEIPMKKRKMKIYTLSPAITKRITDANAVYKERKRKFEEEIAQKKLQKSTIIVKKGLNPIDKYKQNMENVKW